MECHAMGGKAFPIPCTLRGAQGSQTPTRRPPPGLLPTGTPPSPPEGPGPTQNSLTVDFRAPATAPLGGATSHDPAVSKIKSLCVGCLTFFFEAPSGLFELSAAPTPSRQDPQDRVPGAGSKPVTVCRSAVVRAPRVNSIHGKRVVTNAVHEDAERPCPHSAPSPSSHWFAIAPHLGDAVSSFQVVPAKGLFQPMLSVSSRCSRGWGGLFPCGGWGSVSGVGSDHSTVLNFIM